MVSCIDRNSFAFFIFPLFLDTLITLLSLALPTLLLRSPSLISSPLSLPLQANRLLWWIQLSHLNFLQLKADSPTLMTLQRRQTSCTLTYDCAHVLFVCGGTGDRDREKSQCKLSSERETERATGTLHLKSQECQHHSCGKSARLDVLRVFLGCPVWKESEKEVKEMKRPRKSFSLWDSEASWTRVN